MLTTTVISLRSGFGHRTWRWLLIVLVFLWLSLAASVSAHIASLSESRSKTPAQGVDERRELPREWVWHKPTHRFDDMYQQAGESVR